VRVSDDEMRQAMTMLMVDAKLVVEPSGASTVAALVARRWRPEGRRTALILSGGNVDPALLSERLRPPVEPDPG